MKGLNNVNMKKVLADLQQIKKMQQQNNSAVFIMVNLIEDGTLDVDVKFMNGKKYISKTKNVDNILHVYDAFPNIEKNATVILDDMLLNPDMYLPNEIILSQSREVVKGYIDLNLIDDEVGYMNLYLDLCCFFFEQDDEETELYLASEPVLLDIRENYEKLTIEEMVERYKNQRFFTPQLSK